ncbi:glycosyltransferase [Chryseolinea sp. H1M3-3]|uniref:glycosyltransferase n=1 Tax=Chryseolinea sp. H1M3-3 TaxID=3034144 RepID=UPI0023EDFB48|nr:glycosyltransferase [Chryseolinea sp. H1M3-3]
MREPQFSVIIPVYNRPQEVKEILSSLATQSFKDFEVIIVEDGSSVRCEEIVDIFRDQLSLQYFFKPNTGPGPSRNFGFAHARGNYFVVFDSDCILPTHYFLSVTQSLKEHQWDAWGGPDRAHENFTLKQRAMGYTMSSVLTTGGIRGGKKHVGWFQPRSFNMGISRKVFEVTEGFKFDRYAEDIEFSIRMKNAGFKVGLIPDAFVYHKRRLNFQQFYQQVYNFGRGRALVGRAHPAEIKITHWFPAVFLLGVISLIFMPLISVKLFAVAFGLFSFYLVTIFFHSLKENKNLGVALLSIPAALCQLCGYGLGFLKEKFNAHR